MKRELIFKKDLWLKLTNVLLHGGLERMAFLLTSNIDTSSVDRRIVFEVINLDENDYYKRGKYSVTPKPEFVEHIINKCKKENFDLISVHSHPFDDAGYFSGIDIDTEEKNIFPDLSVSIPELSLGSIVVGRNPELLSAVFYDKTKKENVPVNLLKIIDEHSMKVIIPLNSVAVKDINANMKLRNIEIFGEQSQKALSAMTFGIAGAGSSGSIAAEFISRLFPKKIIICDSDSVELTNLNRLLGASKSDAINKVKKVSLMKKHIDSNQLGVEVTAIDKTIQDKESVNALAEADVIIGTLDNLSSRLWLNRFAYDYYLPYFDLGTGVIVKDGKIEQAGMQIVKVIPGTSGCFNCNGLINHYQAGLEMISGIERVFMKIKGYINGEEVSAPMVMPLNGIVVTSAVWKIMKYLNGGLQGNYFNFDAITDKWTEETLLNQQPDMRCIICA